MIKVSIVYYYLFLVAENIGLESKNITCETREDLKLTFNYPQIIAM